MDPRLLNVANHLPRHSKDMGNLRVNLYPARGRLRFALIVGGPRPAEAARIRLR